MVRKHTILKGHANHLTSKTILKRKKLRLHFGYRLTVLCQFVFRAVDFQTREFCKFQGFLQQGADIFKVGQNTLGIFTAFSAMGLIPAKAESVDGFD